MAEANGIPRRMYLHVLNTKPGDPTLYIFQIDSFQRAVLVWRISCIFSSWTKKKNLFSRVACIYWIIKKNSFSFSGFSIQTEDFFFSFRKWVQASTIHSNFPRQNIVGVVNTLLACKLSLAKVINSPISSVSSKQSVKNQTSPGSKMKFLIVDKELYNSTKEIEKSRLPLWRAPFCEV